MEWTKRTQREFADPKPTGWKHAGLLWLLLLALPLAAHGDAVKAEDEAGPEWKIESFRWAGEIGPSAKAEVVNEHGDLRMRFGGAGEVEVSAMIQRREDDPREPEIVIEEGKETFTVRVVYPPPGEDPITDERNRRRVDITVFLPASLPVRARTVKGFLEAKGHTGEFHAETESGKMVFKSSGFLHAKSVHGSITALLRSDDWSRPAVLETVTGDIAVRLGKDHGGVLRASTAGEITTDYSLEISRGEGFTKHALVRLGEGDSELRLKTEKGRIKMLQYPE